jgi:hypothetical protein
MRITRLSLILAFAAVGVLPVAAQVNVNIPGINVNVGNGDGGVSVSMGGKNKVGNTAGHIDSDADIEGVVIINGEVSIDGEKVPRGKTRHTGRKSGTKYVIKWSKDGSVAVSTE